MKVYVKDGLLIPKRYVTDDQQEKVERRFTRDLYKEEKTCEACDYYSERPSDMCEGCQNYGGKIILWQDKTIKGKDYLRLPFGAREQVQKIFGDHKLIDKTPEVPMRRKPEFLGTLRPDQKKAYKAMRKAKHGVLRSPPRSGKTVMSAALVCKLALKTIILASQKDWLDNFHETFVGSENEKPMTDMKKKRIGFPRKLEDFEKYDVCLVTYQLFLSPKGQKLLHKIRNMFSVMLIDEVQTAGATQFAFVVSQFNCRYKIGVSGTPERKDSKEFIFYALLGPVFYENIVPRLRPAVEVVPVPGMGKLPQSWPYMVTKLEKDPNRLKLIAKTAVKDVKAGHMVLIPMSRVTVIKALTQAINILADKNIAESFIGGGQGAKSKDARKQMIDRARKYKTKVIVGTSRLLSTGINIPRASMMYQCTPSSNLQKAEQRFSRILTPFDGKPQPVLKYFLDEADVVKACMRKEHWQCLVPTFRPKIRGDVQAHLNEYFSKKKVRGVNDYSGGMI